MKKKNYTGIEWYRLLKAFCQEDDCFLMLNRGLNQAFIALDHPIDQYRGEHYMKVNVTCSAIGNKVGRGKQNLIVHKCILSSFSQSEIDFFLLNSILIPYHFSEYKEYKDNAKLHRQAKREEYHSQLCEKLNNPAYANKVAQNKKRDEWIKKTKKKNMENSTQSERLLLKTALKRFGKRVKTQYEITINGHIYFLDFYIKSLKVAIEVDGGYHSTVEQSAKDRERDENLASAGIKTVRIKNEQVPINACIEELLSVLNNRMNKKGICADVSTCTYFIGQDN